MPPHETIDQDRGGRYGRRAIARGLERDEDGIWSRPVEGRLRYPEEGHGEFFAIEERSFWFRHRNRCILAALRAHPFEGALIDVGAGNGFVARAIFGAGLPVVALEPEARGARATLTGMRGLPAVVRSTLAESEFTSSAFGAAGCFDVVEHVEDDAAFVAEIAAVLAPEAPLFVTVPAFPSLWSGSDERAQHVRRYTLDTITRLLEVEFEVEYATYFFTPLVAPLFALRSLPHRLGFGTGAALRGARARAERGALQAPRLRARAGGRRDPSGANDPLRHELPRGREAARVTHVLLC